MLIAGLLSFVFVVLWNMNRRPRNLLIAILFAILCGVIYMAERSIVTEGERLQERVVQLCDEFRNKHLEKTMDFISDAHPELKTLFAAAMAMVTIGPDLRLSDFETTLTNENSRGRVHFRANATITVEGAGNVGRQPARIVLTFQREKGEWKIIGVERLNPITGKSMENVLQQAAG
jgi:hypothetical protein